jgi:hypothetical protein
MRIIHNSERQLARFQTDALIGRAWKRAASADISLDSEPEQYFLSFIMLFQKHSTQYMTIVLKSKCNYEHNKAGKKLRPGFVDLWTFNNK